MTEEDLRALRLAGFAVAMAIALLWQKLRPHESMPGSPRVNGGLWLVNIVVMGTLCGACVCSAAHWATRADFGLLNRFSAPVWDSNFGTIFLLWDRFLETYSPSDSTRVVRTGLPGMSSVSFGDALILPLRRFVG